MYATSSAVSQITLCRSVVFPGALTHASFIDGVGKGGGGAGAWPVGLSLPLSLSFSILTRCHLRFCLVIASSLLIAHLAERLLTYDCVRLVVCEHVGG